MKSPKLKTIHHTRHVLREPFLVRCFFWRLNNHFAYTVIILTAYFLTAQILAGSADVMRLSQDASLDQVMHEAVHRQFPGG